MHTKISPGCFFFKCSTNNSGFSRNSNHKTVSAAKGTVLGLKGSISMLVVDGELLYAR